MDLSHSIYQIVLFGPFHLPVYLSPTRFDQRYIQSNLIPMYALRAARVSSCAPQSVSDTRLRNCMRRRDTEISDLPGLNFSYTPCPDDSSLTSLSSCVFILLLGCASQLHPHPLTHELLNHSTLPELSSSSPLLSFSFSLSSPHLSLLSLCLILPSQVSISVRKSRARLSLDTPFPS